MPQIFVSYEASDQDFAIRLANDLRSSGAQVWLDVQNAEPGRYWTRSIERALSDSQMMIVILSPAALDAAHVNVEWQAYLEAHRPMIPVLFRDCDLPGPLRTRRPVDFRRDYARAFHLLVNRLIECGTRTRRVDPVIWTMSEQVQDFREEKAPPPPESVSSANPAENGIRRMVKSLRELLRRRDVVHSGQADA